MDALTARRTLAQARLAVGAAALVAPRLLSRAMGIDPDANPATPYLTRMFGVRELFMAAPFLMPAPGLDEAEVAELVDAAADLSGEEVGVEERADLAAGLAVVREGARYDGTLAGLLADRNTVQSALLAEIATLEQES